jgi:hypothetical protein
MLNLHASLEGISLKMQRHTSMEPVLMKMAWLITKCINPTDQETGISIQGTNIMARITIINITVGTGEQLVKNIILNRTDINITLIVGAQFRTSIIPDKTNIKIMITTAE